MDTALQDPLVGHLIDGRYQVESRIARGGMATVYRALDRRLGRDVALKVMLPHLAGDPEFLNRFVREARAAARLSHPNVVQVFDQGSDGDVLYLAMEYLPGRTLRDVLTERGALTVREALTVLDPVLDALAAAHRAGIVHRDVKPENVILTDDGRVKVADFGLARAVSSGTAGSSKGMLLGTVAYVAPELLTRGIADARADVYAAGILLFEMLTGRQPFAGANPIDVARRHVTEAVPAPSTLVPTLPPDLDHLVIAATAGDPDERPANAQQMLAMSRAVRARLPEAAIDVRPSVPRSAPEARTQVVAPPVPPLRQTRAIALRGDTDVAVTRRPARHEVQGVMVQRRRRGGLALLAVLAAVLLISGAGWWYMAGPGAYQRTPPLVGDTVAQARRALTAAGLRVTQQSVFSDQVKAGIVVATDPPGGGRVRKGGRVVIQVSQGPQLISVPNLNGKSQDDATTAIQQAGLSLGDVNQDFSDNVPSGSVISTLPAGGQKVHKGDQVSLVISKGQEHVQVPDVTGQSQDAATKELTDARLKVVVNTQPADPQTPPGEVISQDPPAGDTAQPGDIVTLTVAAAVPLVTVPDVVGQRFNEARRTLEGLGFQVDRQGFPFFNNVQQQSPDAGQQAPQGSVVTLTVGP